MFDVSTDKGRAILNLIKLSPKFVDADKCIIELCGITDTKEKIEFIEKFFPPVSIAKTPEPEATEEQDIESDYFCLLSTIINEKWSG